jgi:hypothetical protein
VPVQIERISLHHAGTRKALAQRPDHIAILLDGDHLPCSSKQSLGESARPGADLEYGVLRASLECIGYPGQNPGIGKKVLPQTALGPGHV